MLVFGARTDQNHRLPKFDANGDRIAGPRNSSGTRPPPWRKSQAECKGRPPKMPAPAKLGRVGGLDSPHGRRTPRSLRPRRDQAPPPPYGSGVPPGGGGLPRSRPRECDGRICPRVPQAPPGLGGGGAGPMGGVGPAGGGGGREPVERRRVDPGGGPATARPGPERWPDRAAGDGGADLSGSARQEDLSRGSKSE